MIEKHKSIKKRQNLNLGEFLPKNEILKGAFDT